MSDELKKLELEAARIRLMREKLALEDEIGRRNRKDKIAEVTVSAASAVKAKSSKVIKILAIGSVFFAIAFGIIGFIANQKDAEYARASQQEFETQYAIKVKYKNMCREKVVQSLPAGVSVLNWDDVLGYVKDTSTGKEVMVYASAVSGGSQLKASCYINHQDDIIEFDLERYDNSLGIWRRW